MLREFKKPNLQAPRFTPDSYNPITSAFFTALKLKHPQLKCYSETELRRCIKKSNEAIITGVISHRDGVEFPESLGYCFGGACPKPKQENVDYSLSAEHGRTIQHKNWDSDNFLAKIFYTNYEAKYQFKFHDMWQFSACRKFTRSYSANFRSNWKKYIQVSHTLNIAKLFRAEKQKIIKKNKTTELLAGYNEFEGFN